MLTLADRSSAEISQASPLKPPMQEHWAWQDISLVLQSVTTLKVLLLMSVQLPWSPQSLSQTLFETFATLGLL